MKNALVLALPVFLTACQPVQTDVATEDLEQSTVETGTHQTSEFSFVTEDSVTVFGDATRIDDWRHAPVALLFHQGASNGRAEYANIVPVLHDLGISTVTIDQRRGGDRLGGTNRTVDNLPEAEYGYCDAYPDLEATLDYVASEGFHGDIIVWGSSYSASLVVQLASKRSEQIRGALAFSPSSGGPLAACKPDLYLENLDVPLLVLRPASEMENESVRTQLELFESFGYETYVAPDGVHGSSMLNPDRVNGSTEETWGVVKKFLETTLAVR